MRRLASNQIQLFSEEDFNVDTEQGLDGNCDFLLSRSTTPYLIENPTIILVDANKEGLDLSWGSVSPRWLPLKYLM